MLKVMLFHYLSTYRHLTFKSEEEQFISRDDGIIWTLYLKTVGIIVFVQFPQQL